MKLRLYVGREGGEPVLQYWDEDAERWVTVETAYWFNDDGNPDEYDD